MPLFFFLPPFSPLNELFFLHISSLPLVYCCNTVALSVLFFSISEDLGFGIEMGANKQGKWVVFMPRLCCHVLRDIQS
jgi:hypothetical protein